MGRGREGRARGREGETGEDRRGGERERGQGRLRGVQDKGVCVCVCVCVCVQTPYCRGKPRVQQRRKRPFTSLLNFTYYFVCYFYGLILYFTCTQVETFFEIKQ
jgi:hypothetical protein